MAIKSVNQHPVYTLLQSDNRITYEIPKYQREYTWGTKHWEDLIDDLTDNSTGYFLGTIICIDTTPAIDAPKREVVDGQQRLTTISLLLTALYAAISQHTDKLDEEQRSHVFQLKRKLVLKDSSDSLRVVPQTQNYNLDDYKGVLSENKLITAHHTMPKFAGNRRIKKAFEYFKKRLHRMISETTDGDVTAEIRLLFDILEKVNSAVIVMIEVNTHSDAYTLFESLNNRGTPLTAVDLIKNLLLAKLDASGNENINHYFGQWQQILKYIGDDYGIQERFFRHYYNAFRQKLNAPHKKADDSRQYPLGPLATRSTLLDIYEKIIKHDSQAFLDTILESASIYAKITLENDDMLSPLLTDKYKTLSHVQGAPSYLLLLYLEKERKSLDLKDEDVGKIVTLLVNFFIRRNLTDTPPTRDLDRIFMSIIDEIESGRLTASGIYDAIRNKLLERSASDAEFEEKLRGPIYDDNNDATRFVLCALAARGMTIETKVDLWQRSGKVFTWTIEHIFPQGENIPDSWVEMIAGGDSVKAKEYQVQYVHTLGNLTLTGFNSLLSNRSFSDKRDMKDKKTGLDNGYRNGLNLNSDVVNQDVWTVENITARTERLVNEAMKLFKL